jgi:hypothetical protein
MHRGKDGILEEWNNGSLRHPLAFDPIFQRSTIPIFFGP